jgi:hypothetical protein
VEILPAVLDVDQAVQMHPAPQDVSCVVESDCPFLPFPVKLFIHKLLTKFNHLLLCKIHSDCQPILLRKVVKYAFLCPLKAA